MARCWKSIDPSSFQSIRLITGEPGPELIGGDNLTPGPRREEAENPRVHRAPEIMGPRPLVIGHVHPARIHHVAGPLTEHHRRTGAVGDVAEADLAVAVEQPVVLGGEISTSGGLAEATYWPGDRPVTRRPIPWLSGLYGDRPAAIVDPARTGRRQNRHITRGNPRMLHILDRTYQLRSPSTTRRNPCLWAGFAVSLNFVWLLGRIFGRRS